MTDTDISNRGSSIIRSMYHADTESKIIRRFLIANPPLVADKVEFDTYNLVIETVRADVVVAKAKALVVRNAIVYEGAVKRLAQYQLSVGRPSSTVTVPTGNQILDPVTLLMVPETTSHIIHVIDALPATVPSTDMTEVVTQIPNPVIINDNTERSIAQNIVTAATPEILAMVLLRK